MIVHYFHTAMLSFGFMMSMLLFLSIARATPNNIRNYSILIFWGALTDLTSISAHFMSLERVTFLLPTVVYIAVGPCTHISLDFCNYCDSAFCGTLIQSVIIECISFWYRFRILHTAAPGVFRLNSTVICCIIPNIVHMIIFKHMKDYDPQLRRVMQLIYPENDWTGAYLFGLADVFKPAITTTFAYYFLATPALFCYLITTRNRVLNSLKNRGSMSEKTYQMHHIFVKILTLHAILPLSLVVGCVIACFIMYGVYNEEMEAIIFLIACFPPVTNPVLTLWFMRPYREFVARLVFRNHANHFIKNMNTITDRRTGVATDHYVSTPFRLP